MFYTVYKITNKINQKYYIGMHKTDVLDDGYMGSGKILKKAILKYGIDNFAKEILHIFDNEEDMKKKEKELVVISERTYNLNEGGHGGFGFINSDPETILKKGKNSYIAMKKTMEIKYGSNWQSISGKIGNQACRTKHPELSKTIAKRGHEEGWLSFKGKKHSVQTKKTIGMKNSIHQQGKNNSQYGTCWITNGKENKKIKKEELDLYIETGFIKGRTL